MTVQNKYKAICEMLREFDSASRGIYDAAEKVINNPHEWVESNYFPFYANAASLLIDCLDSMDTKTTANTTVSAVKRILKNAKQDNFKGLVLYDGKYVACDGYRLIRLQNDIASLPHTTNNFNVNQAMKGLYETINCIDLPTPVELKAYIIANKRKVGKGTIIKPYNLCGNVWVNPQYLLDMIQALPDCKAYLQDTDKYYVPIYFKAENGDDGALCPVKPPENAKVA